MLSRRMKQVIYGILYLAVFSGIIFGCYFLFLRSPSTPCASGGENEVGQGITCGGVPSSTQPIAALGTVYVFSPVAGSVTILAQIENANSNLAASSFNYTVKLYGADGSSTLGTLNGTSFAYADETKYIILPNEPVSGTVSRADIAVTNIQWAPVSQMGLVPQFTFTNLTNTVGANGYVKISGDITDSDISSFQNIVIVAVFKDAMGMPSGASQTELDSLTPGMTQSFSISYPLSPNENISGTELKAYALREQ